MPPSPSPLPPIADSYLSQHNKNVAALSQDRPVLLVFLRHFGCTFCREAVCEIEKLRPEIESRETQLAFVHLSTEGRAVKFFKPHHFEDVPRFADPEGHLYEAFGLVRWVKGAAQRAHRLTQGSGRPFCRERAGYGAHAR